MIKATRQACHRQSDSHTGCQASEPRLFRIAHGSLSGEDVLRPPAGELPVLVQASAINQQCHPDVFRPCVKSVLVLSGEIGLKKKEAFPEASQVPPMFDNFMLYLFKHVRLSTNTGFLPLESGMAFVWKSMASLVEEKLELKVVQRTNAVVPGCEIPVPLTNRNADQRTGAPSRSKAALNVLIKVFHRWPTSETSLSGQRPEHLRHHPDVEDP